MTSARKGPVPPVPVKPKHLSAITDPPRFPSTTREPKAKSLGVEGGAGKEFAKVLFEYTAEHEDELSLAVGDQVCVISKTCEDSGWWLGELNGKRGVFPDNFVQLVPQADADRGTGTGTVGKEGPTVGKDATVGNNVPTSATRGVSPTSTSQVTSPLAAGPMTTSVHSGPIPPAVPVKPKSLSAPPHPPHFPSTAEGQKAKTLEEEGNTGKELAKTVLEYAAEHEDDLSLAMTSPLAAGQMTTSAHSRPVPPAVPVKPKFLSARPDPPHFRSTAEVQKVKSLEEKVFVSPKLSEACDLSKSQAEPASSDSNSLHVALLNHEEAPLARHPGIPPSGKKWEQNMQERSQSDNVLLLIMDWYRNQRIFVPDWQAAIGKWCSSLNLWEEEPDAWSSGEGNQQLANQLHAKDVKRQDVIYEIIRSEKMFCRTLVIMKQIYDLTIVHSDTLSHAQVTAMLPELDTLLNVHLGFLEALRARQGATKTPNGWSYPVVDKIHDVLIEQFTAKKGEVMATAYSKLCYLKDNSVRRYRELLQSNKHFRKAIEFFLSWPTFKDKSLPDCLLKCIQRPTQYHLLMETLRKNCRSETGELDEIVHAEKVVKELVHKIDAEIDERSRAAHLADVLARFDPKSTVKGKDGTDAFTKEDLKSRELMVHGTVYLASSNDKLIQTEMLLFRDLLVFLDKSNKVYAFQSVDKKKPVVTLENMLVREKPAGKFGSSGLYLIKGGEEPEMYEISTEEQKELQRLTAILEDHLNRRTTEPVIPADRQNIGAMAACSDHQTTGRMGHVGLANLPTDLLNTIVQLVSIKTPEEAFRVMGVCHLLRQVVISQDLQALTLINRTNENCVRSQNDLDRVIRLINVNGQWIKSLALRTPDSIGTLKATGRISPPSLQRLEFLEIEGTIDTGILRQLVLSAPNVKHLTAVRLPLQIVCKCIRRMHLLTLKVFRLEHPGRSGPVRFESTTLLRVVIGQCQLPETWILSVLRNSSQSLREFTINYSHVFADASEEPSPTVNCRFPFAEVESVRSSVSFLSRLCHQNLTHLHLVEPDCGTSTFFQNSGFSLRRLKLLLGVIEEDKSDMMTAVRYALFRNPDLEVLCLSLASPDEEASYLEGLRNLRSLRVLQLELHDWENPAPVLRMITRYNQPSLEHFDFIVSCNRLSPATLVAVRNLGMPSTTVRCLRPDRHTEYCSHTGCEETSGRSCQLCIDRCKTLMGCCHA